MKLYLLISSLLLSFSGFSSVTSGDKLTAKEYNNSRFNIGDIKISILDLTQFQNIHGNCWIKLNQGADGSDVSIAGSDLAVLKGDTIKSASGRTLRAEGGRSASLGVLQEDAMQRVTGDTKVWGAYNTGDHSNGAFDGTGSFTTGSHYGAGNAGYPFIKFDNALSVFPNPAKTDDVETRMQNLTVNMFLKINQECN